MRRLTREQVGRLKPLRARITRSLAEQHEVQQTLAGTCACDPPDDNCPVCRMFSKGEVVIDQLDLLADRLDLELERAPEPRDV